MLTNSKITCIKKTQAKITRFYTKIFYAPLRPAAIPSLAPYVSLGDSGPIKQHPSLHPPLGKMLVMGLGFTDFEYFSFSITLHLMTIIHDYFFTFEIKTVTKLRRCQQVYPGKEPFNSDSSIDNVVIFQSRKIPSYNCFKSCSLREEFLAIF